MNEDRIYIVRLIARGKFDANSLAVWKYAGEKFGRRVTQGDMMNANFLGLLREMALKEYADMVQDAWNKTRWISILPNGNLKHLRARITNG